ncbi:far upstream element-binding protein 3-like isoform X13 [Podarcis muralis]
MAELTPGPNAAPAGAGKSECFVDALHRVRQQMAAKIGEIPHLNNSTPLVDPSVYGYGVKRPLDERIGNQLGALEHQRVITEEFKVPDKMVGFIIGRGGEQISRIQAESGCKIQIAPDCGGLVERPCMLTGTPESIEQAKRLLGQIVDRCRNGPGFHSDMDGNSTIQEILIPASKVGLVIGKGGETIKQLQERTGVKMIMIQDGPLPTGVDKPLRITGDVFKVQQAREMVLEIIREKDQADFRGIRNEFTSRMGGGSIEVSVPRIAVGIVIGRNGEMIKKIQNDAGVRIQFKPDDGISPERVAQVVGLPDRCQHAAQFINELILTVQERDGFGSLVARGRGHGRGDWSIGTPGGIQEITYTVPADKCGLVIGKVYWSGWPWGFQPEPLQPSTCCTTPKRSSDLHDAGLGWHLSDVATAWTAGSKSTKPATEQPTRLQQGMGGLLQETESCCHCCVSSQLPARLHNGLGRVLQTAGCLLWPDIRTSSDSQPADTRHGHKAITEICRGPIGHSPRRS